jgi:hypothetical protein
MFMNERGTITHLQVKANGVDHSTIELGLISKRKVASKRRSIDLVRRRSHLSNERHQHIPHLVKYLVDAIGWHAHLELVQHLAINRVSGIAAFGLGKLTGEREYIP